jgi:hypothetical protein
VAVEKVHMQKKADAGLGNKIKAATKNKGSTTMYR